MYKQINCIIILLLGLLLIYCNHEGKLPEEFDFGRIEKETNKYVNDFLGLVISVPPDWIIPDKHYYWTWSQNSGVDKNKNDEIDSTEINEFFLFAAYENELYFPVDSNPCILFLVVNPENLPKVRKGKEYLAYKKQIIESSTVLHSFEPEGRGTITISNRQFDIMEVSSAPFGQNITYSYIATDVKGLVISFALKYSNEEQRKKLLSILDKIEIGM